MSAVDEGTILRRFFALVAVAVIVGLSAPPARADVVLASDFGPGDTFQTSTGTAWAIGGSQSASAAVAFTIPPGQTYQLTQFRFAANWFAGANTLSVGFFVGSDLNTATLVESFTFSASAFQTPQLFTAVSVVRPLLLPGNTYFIALSVPGAPATQWGWQWNIVGAAGYFARFGSGAWFAETAATTPAFDVSGVPVTGSAVGQVTTSTGTALQGAVVDAFNAATGAFVATTTTNVSGNYSIPLAPGTYKIKAHLNGFLDVFYAIGGLSGIDFTTATPVTVSNTIVTNVNIALPSGGTISGFVHARGTSTPLVGVPVIIFRSAANSFLFRNPSVVTTGSDGSFVFHGLRDGDWIVRVEPQNLGYAISYYSGNADNPATDGSTATPVRIVGANTVSNVNINPAPGGGAIRGRILRSDTLAPVSNLAIQVHFSDAPRTGILPRDSFVAGTSTDGNGQYVFTGLVTGEYIVQAPGIQVVNGTAVAYSNGVASGSGGCSPIFPTGAPQPQTALPVPVTDGFLTDCVNFTVPGFSGGASPRTISGTVRDDAGNPMPFAGVSVEDVVTGYGVAFVVVRGDGSYTVGGLGPRQYHVRTSTTGTSERRWFDDELALAAADVVDVTLGNRIGVDFALPATANTISGKITSADTGKPVMGATVRARGFFNNFYGSDVTQQDGTFLLGGLPAGSYRIDVEAPGFVPRSYTTSGAGGFSSADASLVTVQNGTAAANIDVNMVPATGGGIRGTVTTQQDGPTPVPDALVQIRDAANGSIVAFARTRSDGSFIVPDLGPGQYTLSVFALGFATQWFNGKPTREAADTITVTTGMVSLDQPGVSAFSLSSSQGSISGFVFKADGQTPLEGAGIRIFDAATGGFVSGVGGLTNKNGFYRIASLAPSTAAPGTFLGGYLAQASAPGYASQYFNRATTTATATALTVMNGIDTPNTNFALTQAPELDSISVTSAGRGASGLSLVITGVNLAASASFSFLVNGVNDPCIGISGVTFVNSTQLIVTVEVNACAQLGPHDVMITEPSGTFTLPGALTVTSGPQVLSTNRGSANPLFTNVSTQTVIINGTGFEPPTGSPLSVMFSGTGITVDSVQFTSSSQIAAVVDVAAGAALTPRTVTVVNPDLGTGVSASTIVSLATAPPGAPVGLAPSNSGSTPPAAPALSTLNPSAALLGGSVQLIGTGFSTTLTADSVTFAGSNGSRVPATVMPGATTTQLTVAVPANATDGPVTVAVNGQLSNPLPFAVANPLLSNVLPSSATQGTIVPTLTLKGSKFASNATVTFGGAAGDITFTPSSVVVSPDGTTITIAGVSVSGTAALGARSAAVTSAGGSSTLANAFTVTAPQPVTIVASVNGGDPSLFLPSVRAVSVTLDSTGKCIAPKSVTPQPVTLAFTLTPGPGHTVTATSSTMALSMTSTNIPGTATNEDCELGATPTNDFSFDPINPSVQSGSASSLGTGSLTYQATLYSYDWGGSAVVLMSVTALVDGVTQTVTGTLTVPVDTDTDGLPDAYEKDRTLGANAVGSTPLDFQNAHQNGNANLLDGQARFARDGLSNFAKYRGVYLAGPGPGRSGSMTNQIRLEVGQRHLFAWGRGFGTDPVVKAAPTPSCGVTVDPTTGVVGGPAPDPTLSPTNPCPPFEVGGAFAAINVKVHDVSASFSAPAGATVFPTQSLVTPATPILDLAIVKYDATNCYSGEACAHTSKVGVRNWTFPSLGFSAYGTSTAYGSDIRVFKIPVDAYFADKPYLHQTNLASAIIVAPDGKPMLAPITLVCDSSSKGADNGAADGNECTVGGQLGGDTYVPGSFSRDLSAMAAANDGCTQLPFVSDPRAVQRCGPPGSSTDLTGPQGPYPSATKRQVVRHL
ncbi:MAG: carboxypeptidase regulatory-like domain-containing protein, partial [Bacillati bacterium ANGP1]